MITETHKNEYAALWSAVYTHISTVHQTEGSGNHRGKRRKYFKSDKIKKLYP